MDDLARTKPRLALLLDRFSEVEDAREPWRVVYPLREVLFLVVCATIASCDDYEAIADWARPTSISCAASPTSTTACRARTGCAPMNRIDPLCSRPTGTHPITYTRICQITNAIIAVVVDPINLGFSCGQRPGLGLPSLAKQI